MVPFLHFRDDEAVVRDVKRRRRVPQVQQHIAVQRMPFPNVGRSDSSLGFDPISPRGGDGTVSMSGVDVSVPPEGRDADSSHS